MPSSHGRLLRELCQLTSVVRWENRQRVSFELLLLHMVHVTSEKMSVHWDVQHRTSRLGWRRDLTILFFWALSILLTTSLVGFLFFSSLVLNFLLWIQWAPLTRRWRHWNTQKSCLYRSPPGSCHVLKTRTAQAELVVPCTDSHENGVKNKHFPPYISVYCFISAVLACKVDVCVRQPGGNGVIIWKTQTKIKMVIKQPSALYPSLGAHMQMSVLISECSTCFSAWLHFARFIISELLISIMNPAQWIRFFKPTHPPTQWNYVWDVFFFNWEEMIIFYLPISSTYIEMALRGTAKWFLWYSDYQEGLK